MEYKTPSIKVSVSFDKNVKTSELYKINSSLSAYNLLKNIFNKDTFYWTEELILICMNNSNRVLGYYKLSSGGITGTVADIRVIFTIALKCCATQILLAHNHPSGKLKASDSDIDLTKKVIQAGEILQIKLLDHIILNDESYYSLVENENIF